MLPIAKRVVTLQLALEQILTLLVIVQPVVYYSTTVVLLVIRGVCFSMLTIV